uniref:Uncharacterized protein n=2 Tax=Cacopsylla melanoneura TaxID=428564 RepID=A0A8D8U4N8_9HEMI
MFQQEKYCNRILTGQASVNLANTLVAVSRIALYSALLGSCYHFVPKPMLGSNTKHGCVCHRVVLCSDEQEIDQAESCYCFCCDSGRKLIPYSSMNQDQQQILRGQCHGV